MKKLEYLLPETMEEALIGLERGIPLAGGTALTPRRSDFGAVIDLSKLDLDRLYLEAGWVEIGATTKLQAVVETELDLPQTLREVCKRESGWNLRNMTSIAGTIMSSDGRSPLLTTLLALETQVAQQPGSKIQPLDQVLDQRDEVKLITHIQFEKPLWLLYDQVARSPADFPLVSVAVACWKREKWEQVILALGGYGTRPLKLEQGDPDLSHEMFIQFAIKEAVSTFLDAGDAWASPEYRSKIAGTLVKRLLTEVLS